MCTFFTAKFGEKNFRGELPLDQDACAVFEQKKGIEKVHAWGNQNQAIVNVSGRSIGPLYLHDYLKHTKDIWHGFSKNIKVANPLKIIHKILCKKLAICMVFSKSFLDQNIFSNRKEML